MGRLFIISNRLPFSVERDGERVQLRQSSGGLVSAIKSYFETGQSGRASFTEKFWMGTADFSKEDWELIAGTRAMRQDFTVLPLFVDQSLYADFYNGFSNSVLWPMFHYFPTIANYQPPYFNAYIQVNRIFSNAILPLLEPGDIVWVHDYQLMLLPQMLRKERPEATIGFFLHIPFPSYEIFRLLPSVWKKQLLQGVVGADLVGFHTHDYAQYFIQSVKMILEADNYFHNIQYQERLIRADLFPIGVDYKKFNRAAENPDVQAHREEIKKNFESKKIIFSVDRLDYTKGLMDRLNGFEYFLEKHPEWRDRVVYILNIIPSRHTIPAYNERKRLMEEKISTINGNYSSISWQPIIYRYNHLPFEQLAALYLAADAALITPLRDGMNLVAKEFVASCSEGKGVLILSELAGAANELNEALLVNPTDTADVAAAIAKALVMPPEEQQDRLASMQKRLMDYDVIKWVNDFLDQLANVKEEQRRLQVKLVNARITRKFRRHYRRAESRCLLFDYDGTLVPYYRVPSLAIPGEELKELLWELSSDEANDIIIISGRDTSTLDEWFGSLSLSLVAEHGASFKTKNGQWQQMVSVSDRWKEEIRPILQMFVSRCAGSFIEEKANNIAWHYRNTHPGLGFTRSRELLSTLSHLIQNTTLQVLEGNKVVEVRIAGFDKGTTALNIVNAARHDFVLCMGDDTTDEDMFKALDGRAYTIKVGYGATAAHFTIPSQLQVLPLLNNLPVRSRRRYHARS